MPRFKSVRIGSIDGIVVKVDWSILVIFWLLIWSLAAAGLPDLASGYGTAEYWIAAGVTTFAFFASLLAHELSHCVVARRRGLHVRDVTLWLLGGISTIEQDAPTPSADLHIAIAGPAASLAIGVVALGAAAALVAIGAPQLIVASAAWLGSVNFVLGIFNLVPAAPLDGGRVLRAFRWRQTGDRTRAALDAVRAGRVFAFVLIALGFAELLYGAGVSGFWFVLLGWFLFSASQAEELQVHLTHDLATTRVRALMTADPITVRGETSVESVLHDYVLTHHCSTFPVVDSSGRLTGLVTLSRLRAVERSQRAFTEASAVAWPLAELTVARPDELVLDVLRRPDRGGDGRIIVTDGQKVVGIVSPSDVSRALQLAEVKSTS